MKNIQHITYDEKNRKEITRNMPLKNTKNKPADFKVCFLDTEFNATDYNNQNDGFQEITEIGAVIFQNGRPIDRFTQYCKIKKGHKLTKRCKKITGIKPDVLSKEGIPFNQTMKNLKEFLDKHEISKVYTFGPADAFEMRSTAKLNGSDADVLDTIKRISNVYPMFAKTLSLHYAFSLSDICRICYIDHEANGRAHSALNDAEDTGFAFYNMKRGRINKEILQEINTHKYHVKIYRENRSVNMANIKMPSVVTDEFIRNLEEVFKNAGQTLNEPIVRAMHDDMMRIIGRPDLETGESGL